MPLPKIKSTRWQRIAVYVVFGAAAVVVCFYLTFPYDAVRQRLMLEASQWGLELKISRLGPGFLGISAQGVQITRKTDGDASPSATLVLRSVSLRPSLLPLGLAFSAKALGGNATGVIGGLGDTAVRLDIENVDTADPSIKAMSGLDLTGKLSTHWSLTLPRASGPGVAAKDQELDLSQATGSASLKLDQVLLKGGTVTVPIYGESTPMDLPRVALGNVECRIKFEKGLGKIERLQGKSEELELLATGTVKLAKRIDYSDTNVDLKFKAESDLVNRLGLLGGGLAMLPMDKDNPGFRTARITGFLGRPNFNPGR